MGSNDMGMLGDHLQPKAFQTLLTPRGGGDDFEGDQLSGSHNTRGPKKSKKKFQVRVETRSSS